MKRLISLILLSKLCLAEVALNLTPSAPSFANKGYVLLSETSGTVIAEQNSDKTIEPASLTKLMTLFIVANALEQKTISLEDQVLVSKKAWQQPGSRMFIKAGDHVPVKLLIQGSAVVSGNDATVALAEHIAGSEAKFVELMNLTAQKLGMHKTHFNNSTGLPSKNHYTTPKDLAILAQAWFQHYPESTKWFQQKYFKYNKIKQHNRNQQLWSNKLVDGMKTGYTKAAGYCLVTSAKDEHERLIAVIAGAKSKNARFEQSTQLLNYGFHFYESKVIANSETELGQANVYLGEVQQVPFAAKEQLIVTMPKNQASEPKIIPHIEGKLKAPIVKGQVIGKAEIIINAKTYNIPIIATQTIAKASWLKLAYGYVRMLIS